MNTTLFAFIFSTSGRPVPEIVRETSEMGHFLIFIADQELSTSAQWKFEAR